MTLFAVEHAPKVAQSAVKQMQKAEADEDEDPQEALDTMFFVSDEYFGAREADIPDFVKRQMALDAHKAGI